MDINAPAPTFSQRADLICVIAHTLSQRLPFLDPVRTLPLIERMIELIEVEVGETFEIEVLAGLILHLACVLERGTQQKRLPVSKAVRTRVEQQFSCELGICRRAWQILSTQIAHPLPDEEPYLIVGILRRVDIFIMTDL
jgi:transcriptional regulatory protein LevR